MNISSNLKNKYDSEYTDYSNIWREVNAKKKAENILKILPEKIIFKKVLEVGCGDGSILKYLNSSKEIKELYAIDISKSAVKRTKERKIKKLKKVLEYDGYKIPYRNKAFDLSYCSHVLEHVEYPRLLLREIARVSKLQIFEIPIDFSFNVDKHLKHFLSYGHINIWTPSTFKFLLKAEGFDIINENFCFYSKDFEKIAYKGRIFKKLKRFIRKSIISTVPYLKHIYPDSYVVLCKHTGKELDVF